MSRMLYSNKQTFKFHKIVKKCYTFQFDFTIRSFKQRHPYFQPGRSPSNRLRSRVFIHVINFQYNRKSIFCNILIKVQEIIFHFNYETLSSRQTDSQRTPLITKSFFVFAGTYYHYTKRGVI